MSDDDSLLEYSEIVMKMFGSEDDGFEFYNNYAYEKGFSVRKEYCEWDNGHNETTRPRKPTVALSNNRPAPQQQATWPSALCPAPLSLTCRARVSAAPRTMSPPSLETDTERQLLPNSR